MSISVNCWERLNKAIYAKCVEWFLARRKRSVRAAIIIIKLVAFLFIIIITLFHEELKEEKASLPLLGQIYPTFLHNVESNIEYRTPLPSRKYTEYFIGNPLLRSYPMSVYFGPTRCLPLDKL